MPQPLTDAQLTWLFYNRLSAFNGWRCGRTEGHRMCAGYSIIEDGRVQLKDICGEPCSFLKYADQFMESVKVMTTRAKLIDEAREIIPK